MFDHSINDKSLYIQKRYPVTEREFQVLDEEFGKLCWFAAQKLAYTNHKQEEDLKDYHAEIQIGMLRSASYYKRQTYIEEAFQFLDHCKMSMTADDIVVANMLYDKWANKSSFYANDENKLDDLCKTYKNIAYVPDITAPDKNAPLKCDEKFRVYVKAIIWNTSKSLGQLISKENERKNREISLDEWIFLEGGDATTLAQDENISTYHNYASDFNVIGEKLSSMPDKRPKQVFDVISDPENYTALYNHGSARPHSKLKINVVRRKTGMSYATISKQIKIIKKMLVEELS